MDGDSKSEDLDSTGDRNEFPKEDNSLTSDQKVFESDLSEDNSGESEDDDITDRDDSDDDDDSSSISSNENILGRSRKSRLRWASRKRSKNDDVTSTWSKSALASLNPMPSNIIKKKPARKTVVLQGRINTSANILGTDAATTSNKLTKTSKPISNVSELTVGIRTTIYSSIRSTMDTRIGGAIIPILGEFERVARLFNVSSNVVSEIWHEGQRVILDQILALATANPKLMQSQQQDLLPNFSYTDSTIARSECLEQPDHVQPETEPSASAIITKEAIAVAVVLTPTEASLLMDGDRPYDPLKVIEIIDALPKQKGPRSLQEIAKVAGISKAQLVHLITKYPRIHAFQKVLNQKKSSIKNSSKKHIKAPDDDNETEGEQSISERGVKKEFSQEVAYIENNQQSTSSRKRKKPQISYESDTGVETKTTRKKRKPRNNKMTKTATSEDSQRMVNDEGERAHEINTEDEAWRPRRKGRGDIADADKEAVWIVLQSKYDPVKKKLPHGLIEQTARQFNFSKSTIGNIWKRGLESIKKQQEELLGVTGIDDDAALKTLSVGGIVRVDVKSRRVSNCGRKPKHDVKKINEMLNELPIDQKKSFRQAAQALGVSRSFLLRAVKKYNPSALASQNDLELKVQLKQQRVLRDKVRQEVIRQQKILNKDGSGRPRKNQNKDNSNNNDTGTMQQSDYILQPNDVRDPGVTNPPPQQVIETAAPNREQQWAPPAPTNESYWY